VSSYCFSLRTGMVTCSACSQKTISLSSWEAEYIAVCHATQELVGLHALLLAVNMLPTTPHNVVLGYCRIRPAEVDKSPYQMGQPIVGRPMACSHRVRMGQGVRKSCMIWVG
ncbi:hypothetical protein PAXRUDRAFT_180490, partial [Paxillus rubicundulus Ve08.2h10]